VGLLDSSTRERIFPDGEALGLMVGEDVDWGLITNVFEQILEERDQSSRMRHLTLIVPVFVYE